MYNIEKFNNLFDNGNTVIYWTSRGVKTGIDHHALTRNQLERWGVKYSELWMNKPYYDFWIDDKCRHISEFLKGKI